MNQSYLSQLDLKSLIKVSATIGCGGGVVVGLIMLIIAMFSDTNFVGFLSIIATPLYGLISSVIYAVLGYPIYKWWCNKIKGQKISGIFVEHQQ
ncbi:hypothetical protein [Neptunicella sp.]|uniref:hypothetical protein n=1 Tax=Neptunicella sp. TaxID=2125986 RepID=UPI003F692EAD